MRSFKRRLVKVRLHFLLTSSAFVLIFQRVRGEVASVAGGSGSSKAKFRPVPPAEVEVEDDPLPTSPTFLSDGPESDVEPETSRGGGRRTGVSLQACLRCSKRIDQSSSHTSRGRTVFTGYLCDIGTGVCRKCSYCAHTKHDCEPVSYSPTFLGFADASRRFLISFVMSLAIFFRGVLLCLLLLGYGSPAPAPRLY